MRIDETNPECFRYRAFVEDEAGPNWVTLLDAAGIKVHEVSYTKEQARQPGRTIPFQA